MRKSFLYFLFSILSSPIKTPEIFHELKLLPSGKPCGILICIEWVPASKFPKSIKIGFVTVPGHQLERL